MEKNEEMNGGSSDEDIIDTRSKKKGSKNPSKTSKNDNSSQKPSVRSKSSRKSIKSRISNRTTAGALKSSQFPTPGEFNTNGLEQIFEFVNLLPNNLRPKFYNLFEIVQDESGNNIIKTKSENNVDDNLRQIIAAVNEKTGAQ